MAARVKLVRTKDLNLGDMVATYVEDGDEWMRSPDLRDLMMAVTDTRGTATVVSVKPIVHNPGTHQEWHSRELKFFSSTGKRYEIYANEDWVHLIRRRK